MDKNNKPLRKILLAIILIPLSILAIAIYPFIHSEHISSLGRFSKTIEIGHSEDSVSAAFNSFQKENFSTTKINETIATIDLYGRKTEGRRIISLYQDGLFDNIEFRVLFENNIVAQKAFIGD